MIQFKPSEIRVIIILSILALAGSALVLIQRYDKAARFNISLPLSDGAYNYRYSEPNAKRAGGVADTAAQAQLAVMNKAGGAEKIDINACGFYDFEALPGIGPALAERIMAYRDSIGRFTAVDDLLNVKGIGPAKYAQIEKLVEVK